MDEAALLTEVEGLTHSARQRRMIELGRASLKETDTKALLAALAKSTDAYARSLAVASLFGSRDGSLAVELIRDRSRTVRQRAQRVVPLICDDLQAAQALERSVTTRSRTRLAMALRRYRRITPIDLFFESKTAAMLVDDKTLIDALPFASDATVVRSMATLEQSGGPAAWARLVKVHPTHFSRFVTAAIAKKPDGTGGPSVLNTDWRLRQKVAGVAGAFAKRDPTAGLALMRLLLDGDGDPNSPVVRSMVPFVLRKHPREMFDVLRARHERAAAVRPPGAFGMLRLDKVARHLGPERLAYIVEHAWSTLSDGKRAKRWFMKLVESDRNAVLETWLARGRAGWGAFLFRHIPATDATDPTDPKHRTRRETAYERWSIQAQHNEGTIPVHVLQWLPSDLRHREAKRHLALPILSTRPDLRNTYASLLPFEEAKATLASFLGHPEGEERAKAVRILIGSVFHEPASIAEALATVRARKFEQDPVRLAMMDALSQLPVRRFEAKHLDDVGAIVTDALDAADLSFGTAAAVERLVVRLFRIDAKWGAKWLTTILEKRGTIAGAGGLADALTPSDVDQLAPGLVELSSTWATQERSGALLWLARSLGLRLGRIPALLDVLERMSRAQPFVGVAALSLALLRKHAPKRFQAIVPELLASDTSYVIVADVATFLSVYRQDLLPPFVSDTPMTGRFATGRTSWAIRFARGHGRWTSRLHMLHAEAWTKLLSDEKRDVPTLIQAIGALGDLAFAPRDALLPFASDPRQPVRETAIRALPWLDEGQGVPTLLACLGDDRARWAIYALRKAFSEMSRERVLEYLRGAPTNKVTVAKEVMRLLGELGGREAYDVLLTMDSKKDVHRDVRIALLRALWDHLEREETWPIFERAVSHPDWVVASRLADIPLDRLSLTSQDRVVDMLIRILARPEPEARLDLLTRMAYLPITDTKRTLIRALVNHLGAKRPDEALAAARAVLARMHSSEVELVMGRLRELSVRRDLMVQLVPAFAPNAYSATHIRQLAESIVTMLARDPLATVHYVRFAGHVFGWKELGAVLEDLAKRDFLHSDAMIAAYDAIKHCVHPAILETQLAKHANPRMRRLGVEALRHAASPSNGWSRERRAKLETYRNDKAPLVAGAAAYIFPPD